MGNIGKQCVDNGEYLDEHPFSTFQRAMKLYKQPVMIKNEFKFNEGDKAALLKELDNINYVLLDYVKSKIPFYLLLRPKRPKSA